MKLVRLLLLSVPLLVSSARAEDDPHVLLKHAGVYFDLGRFTDAAAEYEKVYLLKPVPDLLYNIAQSYRLGGDMEKALFFYRRYLAKAPGAKNAAEVQRRITELEAVRAAQQSPPNDTTPLPAPTTTRTTSKKTPAEKEPPVARTTAPAKTPPPESTPPPTTTTASTATTTTTTTTNPTKTTEEPPRTATTSTAITDTTPPPPEKPARSGSKLGVIVGVTVAGVLVLGGVGVGLGVGLAPGPSFNPTVSDIGPGPHMGALVGF